MKRAVFLDRDGVINRTFVRGDTPYPPQSAVELEVLPGVLEALALLKAHDFMLLVVTNQPDVARGSQTRAMVETINRSLQAVLPIDAFYVCYHDNADNCDCRKPKPGLLLQGAADYGIDTSRSFMIGDRWSDITAGYAAGCATYLLDVPYNQRQRCTPDYCVLDLLDAAQLIIKQLKATPEV